MKMEELLNTYDIYHSGIVNGNKIKFNINYLPAGNVYISLVTLINQEEKKYTIDVLDNDDFKNCYLPKILEYYFSKNNKVKIRKIMGTGNNGTLVVQRDDLCDSLIIRNCSLKVMNLVEEMYNTYSFLSKNKVDATVIIDSNNLRYETYLKYNVLFDYAKFKRIIINEDKEIDKDMLFLLNIARYAYSIENMNLKDALQEVEDLFVGNEKVVEICDMFQANDYSEDSLFSRVLNLAEYEKNNNELIEMNGKAIDAAEKALECGINFFDDSYMDFWSKMAEKFENDGNEELASICRDFLMSHDIIKTPDVDPSSGDLLSKIKEIKTTSNVENKNTETPSQGKFIISPFESEQIKKDAEEQAIKIIQLEKEREELIEAADEYAKIILKNAQEYEMIKKAAEEQATRIIELEKQNEELKKMAEENARYILDKEQLYQYEQTERKEQVDTPVQSQDIDKINNLLYAISTVKNLDFAVNHPVISQELSILEEKAITYLVTHKNIVESENIVVPIEKEEMVENKPIIELISMIRNAYKSSHEFESDGRHTVINLSPIDEDTYRVSLYSIKDDEEDLLMDAFFEQYQLTDSVIEEICDIYKDGAVIVASKRDNIPPDKADFLAIDNMNNAIRFLNCNKVIIDKVNECI